MAYWLLKSEPTTFSYDDLERAPKQTTTWEGVRNHQARNYLQAMRRGDQALFYHSSCAEPGAVGIVEVVSEARPDETAFDPEHRYYDAQSDPARPRWYLVEVRAIRRLARPVTLAAMKADPQLADFALLRRGNRLSVLPVTQAQWQRIVERERHR